MTSQKNNTSARVTFSRSRRTRSAWVRPFRFHAADGQDQVVGLSREQVPAARAAVPKGAHHRRDDARSRRSRPEQSTPSRCRAPSRPSGKPGCRRSRPAGSPPGSRPSARRDRFPTRRSDATRPRASAPSSARCRPAWPAGARASRDRRSQGDDARDIRLDALARTSCDPLDDPDHVRVVLVHLGHHLERVAIAEMTSAARMPTPNLPTSTAPSVNASTTRNLTALTRRSRRNDIADSIRKSSRSDDRCQNSVERSDQERCQQRFPEVPDVESGEDRGRAGRRSRRSRRAPATWPGAAAASHGPGGAGYRTSRHVIGRRHRWALSP